jgi:hypothetical protein
MSFWTRHYWRLTPLEWLFILAMIALLASFEECARRPPSRPPALSERAS